MKPYSQLSEWIVEPSLVEGGIKKCWYVVTSAYEDVINIPNAPEAEANAKLIASAPDLLKIAKRVAFMLDNYPIGSMGKELAEDAKAAINKATN